MILRTTMLATLWFAAVVWLTACGHTPLDGAVCVDPALAPEYRADVHDAAQQWRDASDGGIDLRVDVGADACDVDLREMLAPTYRDGRRARGAAWNAGGGLWRVRIDFGYTPPEYRAVVVAHELGHTMGAEHTGNPAENMYGDGTTARVTRADALQVWP